jgi:Fe-S cluster assembly protein SufD
MPMPVEQAVADFEELRRAASARFRELGYPSTHDEDWKFTNLAPLTRISFGNAGPGDFERAQELLRSAPDGPRLVFVNGRFAPALSNANEYATADLTRAENHVARYADYRRHSFVALNTASFEDGALVEIPRGAVVEDPIHLIYVSTDSGRPHATHPRSLIVAGEGSQASIGEVYLGDGQYFTNAVTEVAAGAESSIEHCKIQQESADAFHIATIQIEQERGSVFRSQSFAFGGRLARTEINPVLEQGSECTLDGLYIVRDGQHVDTRTSIDHAKPHASSRELYKGILDGRASAVFNGKIIVRKDAQKTDAKQTNKNLMLSEDATINTKPQLEIFADDVRCTHGATVGQIDAEAMFYLRSRGVGVGAARKMLIDAFAGEIVDRVKSAALREYLGGLLL